MVERKTGEIEECKAKVDDVQLEDSEVNGEKQQQVHITLEPQDIDVGGKTGYLHTWIRVSPSTEETRVPEGSTMDRYLQEVEDIDKDARTEKWYDAFRAMVGKTYKFKKKTIGKSYQGHAAKRELVPVEISE